MPPVSNCGGPNACALGLRVADVGFSRVNRGIYFAIENVFALALERAQLFLRIR